MLSPFNEARFRRLIQPVMSTDAPWLRLHEMLGVIRRENRDLGGDDTALAHLIAGFLAAFVNLPVQGGPDQ